MWRRTAVPALLGFLLLTTAACRGDDDERAPDLQSETPQGSAASTQDGLGISNLSPTPTVSPTSTPSPTPSPTATAEPVEGAGSGVEPVSGAVTELRIPSLGVASAIEPIGLVGNQLDVPKNPHNTGWYSIYDAPGAGGNAVFSAHVNYYPDIIGPFHQLASLGAGAQVVVVVGGQDLVYEVFSNQRYSVSSIPMGDILWPAVPVGEEWVTLITCGGRFVSTSPSGAGEYLDRDVVVARRVQ
jgi:sortase (surface protein transpeptidase)